MKIITKIIFSSGLIVLIAMQSIAETSSATTASAIQIDNVVPEPGTFLAISVLLIFFKVIRK